MDVWEEEGNHPLSIEAIFPTRSVLDDEAYFDYVTILCQSRLFFPPITGKIGTMPILSNHPLSIEAIFPTNGG